jgi:hypothetical protein
MNRDGITMSRRKAGSVLPLNSKHRRRRRLLNTIAIDSIYEKHFLSSSSIMEAIIVDAFILPGALFLLSVIVNC